MITKRKLKLYELPFAFGIFGLWGGGLIVFVVCFLLMLDDVFKGGKDKEWFAQGHRRVGRFSSGKNLIGESNLHIATILLLKIELGGQPMWTMFLLTRNWW